MRYLDEYRRRDLAERLAERIAATAVRPLRFMEVCGTHTVSIFRHGLRDLLPAAVQLLSGPGCPVCVTAQSDVDRGIELALQPGVILATYGDMLRVGGTRSSLERERARGADIRVVYAASDALELARAHPDRRVVFLGVGFETTAPAAALTLLEARQRQIDNYLVLSLHKLIGPPLRALLADDETRLDGFILPGHVSIITGVAPYEFIPPTYGVSGVITGFEPLDVLQAVYRLAELATSGRPAIEIQYTRAVRPEGNRAAQAALAAVFEPCDALWRGLGRLPGSGLRLRPEYAAFDAERAFSLDVSYSREPTGCECGSVLRGLTAPLECRLFGRGCTPEHPVGPCMVSSEGTCAAYYLYGR